MFNRAAVKTSVMISGLIALMLAPASHAAKPSFDCAKAEHEVEQLICKDDGLAELDQSLASLYALVLKHTPAADQRRLKAEQRGWIKGRNDCWKSDDMRRCAEDEYRMRIKELKDK